MRELNMDEMEQVNGGVILSSLLIGGLVTGTIALFAIAAA